MYYKAQEKFVRVKYNPKLDPGSLENVKNILDANPLQGVMERIYEIEEEFTRAEETFIRNSLVEVGVDPDALIRTAKLNAHLQTVLKNTMKELEEAKRKAPEFVRCKDCKWFIPKHIKLNDGTTRAYTEEEKKLPFGVGCDVGVNCGSRCMRYLRWEENSIPVWVQENDFCSYGKRKESNDYD